LIILIAFGEVRNLQASHYATFPMLLILPTHYFVYLTRWYFP
jgi:hypothetical protein